MLEKALHVEPSARYANAGAFFEALSEAVTANGEAQREAPAMSHDPLVLASAPTEEFVSGRAAPEPRSPTVSAEPASGSLGENAKAPPAQRARTTEPHALQSAGTDAPERSRRGLVLAVGVLLAGGIAVMALTRPDGGAPAAPSEHPAPPASASAPPVEPTLGLKTLAQYRDPPSELAGKPLTTTAWRAAAKSFEVACAEAGAPRWCAAKDFCEAQIAFIRDQLDDAEMRYRSAAALDPSWAMPHVGLAAVWTQRRDIDKALDQAAVAQQLEPSWWGAIAAGARAYSALDRFDGAIAEYRRALALAPDSATLLSELALTYHAARMDTEAESTAKQALQLSPDLVHVRVMLAERALEAQNGAEALLQADKALAIAPRHVTSLLARADALALLARNDDAREAYERMLEVARASGSGKLEPRLQLVADALEKKQLPAPRGARPASAPGVPSTGPAPKPERSKPAPTCRCAPGDPLCSCL